jgi:hypothetical protein
MILTDLPYFNEYVLVHIGPSYHSFGVADILTRPGYGQADPKSLLSIAYNKNIAVQTVRWAMVEWLKDENKTSIWAVSFRLAAFFLTLSTR